MTLPADYHMHTACSDGAGTVEDLVQRAVALGLPEIGITDHLAPAGLAAAAEYAIAPDRLEAYVDEVGSAAARHPQVTVLLGVEADFVPEHQEELARLLATHSFDYVLGAVHFIDGFAFDDEAARDDGRWERAQEVYRRNYQLLAEAARSGLFDVLAHLDYVTLWDHPVAAGTAADSVAAAERAALETIAACGVAVELNTGGVVAPDPLMHPRPRLLAAARRAGVPLVFGSDAHAPDGVGALFAEGVTRARAAGYRSWLRLSDRRQVPFA